MQVDSELIKKVAKNARLNLTTVELNEFEPQFKEILENFSELSKLDTSDVKPSFHPIEIKNNFREDIVKESIDRDEILKNSKHKKDGYFLGPKAL